MSFVKSTIDLLFRGDPLDAGHVNATDPHVVYISPGQWAMYFTSMDLSGRLHIFVSVTMAGTSSPPHWYAPVKVLSPGEFPWCADAVECPHFLRVGDGSDSKEYLYFTCWRRVNGEQRDYKIGVAVDSGIPEDPYWKIHHEPALDLPASVGTLAGDQSVVYKDGLFTMFFQYLTPAGQIVTATAESTNGLAFGNIRTVPFSPPSAPPVLPNGPYHLDVVKLGGMYYYVGWLPMDQPGIWMTSAIGLKPERATDFKSWKCILAEDELPAWAKPTDPAMQSRHDIGLFGSCLVDDGVSPWLFFHVVVKTDTGGVGHIGRVKLSRRIFQN